MIKQRNSSGEINGINDVDVILIIGNKNDPKIRELSILASETCSDVHIIESEQDITFCYSYDKKIALIFNQETDQELLDKVYRAINMQEYERRYIKKPKEELNEKPCFVDDSNTDEQIDSVIKSFMDDVIRRRRLITKFHFRNKNQVRIELQASCLINSKTAGFKVNEEDGKTNHAYNFEILAQIMNGYDKVIESSYEVTDTWIRDGISVAWTNVEKYGVTATIKADPEEILISMETELKKLTNFQTTIITKIFLYLAKILEEYNFKEIHVRLNKVNIDTNDKEEAISKISEIISYAESMASDNMSQHVSEESPPHNR